MDAPLHPRESERLFALQALEALDTAPEAEFDDLVRLAADICGLPMSLVSLVDADRQWFKADYGLGVPETPRRNAVCAHAILQDDDYLEIPDTLADPRTQDNEICFDDPNIRFYAGAVLRTADDLPIGTLCVLGNEPHQLDDFQRRALKTLARAVMRQLQLKMALKQAEILSQEIDHRVKNSLATVAAVVRTYAARMDVADPQAAFTAIQNRVSAIALLHQELQQATDGQSVRLDRYLDNVTTLLARGVSNNVRVDFDAVPLSGLSPQATSLGIILNEFVSNSTKHAFPDGRTGHIKIALTRDGDTTVMTLSDNGVGNTCLATETSDIESLGERLMQSAATQLGATLDTVRDADGCRMRVVF